MSCRRLLLLIGLACAVTLPRVAWAYDFVLTQLEFAGWPVYCQARYVTTNVGQASEFARAISSTAIETAKANVGTDTFTHIHHFCAGLIYLSRARLEVEPPHRKVLLDQATGESLYTFSRVPTNSPLYSTIASTLAQIEIAKGNPEGAKQHLAAAMNANPSDPRPYVALAAIQWKAGNLALARQTLEKGYEESGSQSMEIAYNLGLVCAEAGDIDCAVTHAKTVYSAGFPLMGLKNRLIQLSRWPG